MQDPKEYPTNVFSQVIILLEDLTEDIKEHLDYIVENIKENKK